MDRWAIYWTTWFFAMFVSFLVPEVYALLTNVRNTLSWRLWDLEGFIPGQPVAHWTAAHFLIGGVLLVFLVWLIGHLIVGIWV